MENIKSKLSFINYKVKSVQLQQNDKFKSDGEPINIDFKITHNTTIKENEMKIEISVIIFDDAEKKNYPFYMQVILEGNFKIEGNGIEAFEMNGIALLYPYIRAVVSTYTANSNMPTLILPPINVSNYYKEYKKMNKN